MKTILLPSLLACLLVSQISVQAQTCPTPTGVSASPTSVCLGSPVTLNATIPSGATTTNWYTTATGGTPVATTTSASTTYTPAAAGTYTFYAEAVGSGGGGSGTPQNFVYTGSVQQVTLQPGTYTLETWGADGGGSQGGKGGYATGTLTLVSATTVYVVVGGAGGTGGIPADLNGGYNGGGPRPNPGGATRGSGGGATHIATATGLLSSLSGNQSAVKIVSGGGGGGSNAGAGFGYGGGLLGQNGNGSAPGLGGTQVAGGSPGAGTSGSPGTFGQGGQSLDMAGAGGGGWYGGGAGGGSVAGNTGNGGGGGSSYIGGVTAGVTVQAGQTGFVTKPITGTDGYVRITPQTSGCTASTRVATATVTVASCSTPCPTPTNVSATPTSVCLGSPVTLNATIPSGATTTNWYTAATGGTAVASTTSGSTTYTPTAAGTYTFYAEASGGSGGSGTPQNFSYTGAVQSVTLQPGIYQLETWGANGGATAWKNGGKGGYSSGTIALASATQLYIYVGEVGHVNSTSATPSSFGGGGSLVAQTNSSYPGNGASGGGASDIRVLADNLYNRIIVGGGGGGANSYGNGSATYSGDGGHGGGTNGNNGQAGTGTTYGPGYGGTQTAGGAIGTGSSGTLSTPGTFGYGGNGLSGLVCTGGGGGWYGGGSSYAGGGAGGGSGYVLTATSGIPSGYFAQQATYQMANAVTAVYNTTGFITNPDASGNGYVRITPQTSGCTASTRVATATVTVHPLPTPTITAGGQTTFCAGGSVTLTSSAANGYTWSNGAATQATTVTTSGNYTVKVTDANGCTNTSAPTAVTVNPLPNSTISASGSTSICAGSSVTLSTPTGTGLTYQWLRGGNPITPGGTTSSYVVTTAGSYTVKVTNTVTGCTDTTAAPTVVIVNPVPTTASITVSGDTVLCEGETVRLLANFDATYTYQWYEGSLPITGATNVSYTTGYSGNYSVEVKLGICPVLSVPVSVVVNVVPIAVITPTSSTTICQGNSVTLQAPVGIGWTYVWYQDGIELVGATSSSYAATATGSYTVVIHNVNCSDSSAPVTVTMIPVSSAVTVSGPTTICQGESVLLSAVNDPNYTYQWMKDGVYIPNATFYSFAANQTGDYQVAVLYTNCNSTSVSIHVTEKAVPVPIVVANGNLLTTASFYASYQWYLNGYLINGATLNSYTASQSGTYSVAVTDSNGCSAGSLPLPFVTRTDNVSVDGIKVYPNPATSVVMIDAPVPVHVYIYAMDGKEVLHQENAKTVKIEDLANGVYMMRILNNNNELIKVERIVKEGR